MQIAFIQPKTFHTWEALNIGYLVATLKGAGYRHISFYSGFFDTDKQITEGCKNADIICFSCTSPQMKHALQLAEIIKTKSNRIVFGGVHPSVLPQDCLKYGFIDFVVAGEGERGILKIINGAKDKIIKEDYISNLDLIPFPDRAVIKQERNIKVAFNDNKLRIASIFSSRGCPFNCTFCASQSVWSRKVRFRSPDNILDEIDQLIKNLKIDFLKFSDDTFTLKSDLIKVFCEGKIKRGIRVPWGCNIRANTVDKESLNLMKKAGCKEVWIGVESGSLRILKEMRKDIDLAKIKWVFKITKEMGFFRRAYMMLGMPGERLEDIRISESLVDEIKPDMVGFTILAPYPGTFYYDEKIHKNVDWSQVDEYGNTMTRTRYLSNCDLQREQKRLVLKYKDKIVFRQK